MWFDKAPRIVAAFILLLIGHYAAAVFLPVADCDETFNFLEPIHQLLYGSGLQTWENCPLYALRSWLFTWIYAIPAFFVSNTWNLRNVDLYFLSRILYGNVACFAELFLVCSVWKEISGKTAAVTLVLLLFNYPISHAAVSALPTSFVMINYFMALGCWLRTGGRNEKDNNFHIRNDNSIHLRENCGNNSGIPRCSIIFKKRQGETRYIPVFWTVFFVVFASAVVWPFAGFAALPIAIDLLVRFPKVSACSLLLSLALIVPLAVGLDTLHYCRLTWSSWNLLRYNLQGGAELYGVEPWYYFTKNLLLNAHILFVAGMAAPCVILLKPTLGSKHKEIYTSSSDNHSETKGASCDVAAGLRKRPSGKVSQADLKTHAMNFTLPLLSLSRGRMLLYTSPFFLWFLFWLTVAHKEERFMAPVYPFLVFAAALTFTHVFFNKPAKIMATNSASSSLKMAPQNSDRKEMRPCRSFYEMLLRFPCLLPSVGYVLLLLFGALSFSRGMAVYHFYAGPQRLLYDNYNLLQNAAVQKAAVYEANTTTASLNASYTLCVGREWYRFPSSFFLDPHRARVAFLKMNGFSGALPLPFARDDAHATCRCGAPSVNNLNQEISEQYVSNSTIDCDVIFDSFSPYDLRVSQEYSQDVFGYSLKKTEQKLLDVDRTPLWCRVLYYPFGISERCAVWRRLLLLGKNRVPNVD